MNSQGMRIVPVKTEEDWLKARDFVKAQTGVEQTQKPAGSIVYLVERDGKVVATFEYREMPMIDIVFDRESKFEAMRDAFFCVQAAMDMCGKQPIVVVTQDCVVHDVASRYLDPMPGVKALMKMKEVRHG